MKKSTNISKLFRGSILIVALLVLWQFLSTSGLLPAYLLPSPVQVIKAFVQDFPLLVVHSKVTLLEAAMGLFFGSSRAFSAPF